jgi:hypothetical protein
MRTKILLFSLISALVFPNGALFALTDSRGFELDEGFDPNLILMDDDVFSTDGMTFDRMVSFLRTKGTLADYRTTDIDGTERTAAEIIWRMAHSYEINPKMLMALLQKEQSLVEDPAPSERQMDWAMGFGVCDSCSKDDPAIADFRGFANQVYYAARQMREKYYLRLLAEGETLSGYAVGKPVTIDGIQVTPANYATASLYTYTPHIHGNLNLWRIWRRWFSKKFPNGSVVKGIPSGQIWWIRYGEKRPFASMSVAATLVDTDKMMEVPDSELLTYEEGDEIRFPNYALLKDPSGKIWLIVDDERRHIVNMETFRAFGFNMDEVSDADDAELSPYAVGEKITLQSMYPQGRLVQVQGLRAVWYAEGESKRLLEHPALLTLYFAGQRPQQITQETLDELRTDDPYLVHDGELIKADDHPAVYVVEEGEKRAIPSAEIFEEMGWKWTSIERVPQSLLDMYPDGPLILLEAEPVNMASQEIGI